MSASLKSGSIPFLLCLLAAAQEKKESVAAKARNGWEYLPLGVDTNQAKFLPAAIYHVSDTEVKLTAHDDSVRFSCQHIHMIETDSIDLIVDIKAVCGLVEAQLSGRERY